MKEIIIVGGGISGIYTAIQLLEKNKDIAITIIEQNDSVLKKLLATGNGRCNLSNKNMSSNYFMSDNQHLVEDIIRDYQIQDELMKLGIATIYQNDLLYPKSEQAQTIKEIFLARGLTKNVKILTNKTVTYIDDDYVYLENQQLLYSKLILALGSEAGSLSGSGHERYDVLHGLNLKVITPRPALTKFILKKPMRNLKGVRVKGTLTLLVDGVKKHQEVGEILFTDYGVSGIAVMQLSMFFEEGHKNQLQIDLFDSFSEEEMSKLVIHQLNQKYEHFFDGLVHQKLSRYFEKMNCNRSEEYVQLLKHWTLDIKDISDYRNAQVMKGGLSLEEVHNDLSLKKHPHIYVTGELLNVAGMCGGYNIHFALSCAKRVASSVLKE